MAQNRKQEIIGMLDAYRCGWIQYDSRHVAELRAELAKIKEAENV